MPQIRKQFPIFSIGVQAKFLSGVLTMVKMDVISEAEKIENLCPVCGYQMDDPPCDYNICPSCGTEFGVHDVNSSIQELRQMWIMTGPRWWSTTDQQPSGWNPFTQLARLGLSAATVVTTSAVFKICSTTSQRNLVRSGSLGWPEPLDPQLAYRPLALELP